MAREIQATNDYRDVLLKLIPSEIVAAYMVIDGAVSSDRQNGRWLTLGASILLLALTPLYLRRLYGVRNKPQIVFTTLSFVVWLYSLGGPFQSWGLYYAPLSSVILVLWTLITPLVVVDQAGARLRSLTSDGKKIGHSKDSSASSGTTNGEGPTMSYWNLGSAILIARDTPPAVNTGSEIIEWNREMNAYLGKEGSIIEESVDGGSVRLDIDEGRHWWATRWLEKVQH